MPKRKSATGRKSRDSKRKTNDRGQMPSSGASRMDSPPDNQHPVNVPLSQEERRRLERERRQMRQEASVARYAELQRAREERLRLEAEKVAKEKAAKQVGKGSLNSARLTDTANFQEQYVTQHNCGSFVKVCNHCKAFSWAKERDSLCCKKGAVTLPPIPTLPPKIMELYDVNQTFLQRIRSFNNAFALASLGCNQVRFPTGVSCFKVQGKIHHFMGSLLPLENEAPKFAQLYFIDSEHELTNRSMNLETFGTTYQGISETRQAMDVLNRNNVVASIQEALHESNPFVRSFKTAMEIESPEVKLVLSEKQKPRNEHSRRYNLPESSEVAVVIPGEDIGNLDIVVQKRSGGLQRISTLHRFYDPLHYVIPFPYGTEGWQRGLLSSKGKTLTQVDFYSYRLQVREGEHNTLMRSRRLLQQYAVDQWAKVQLSRLEWIEHNQKNIRAEKYCGLFDALTAGDLEDAGTRIILPPTVYGSPRFYTQAFQNAMTLVRKFGKPDFFITFTCNPKWPEIQSALFPGEQANDRPDLCARVFKLKLDALMDDLLKKHVMGKVIAHNYTIEWQKRGLTHAHILLIMDDSDKPRNPEIIDKIVSAELPDKDKNPRLFDVVISNMIHGPCGNMNRNCSCMKGEGIERKCGKKFPMSESITTFIPTDSTPKYRRRLPANNGAMFLRNGFHVDNSWVVPYNPFLLLKYNAHINVEVVHSVQAVKYLYKYINKGPDRIMVAVTEESHNEPEERNEVQEFVNARYISASEAFWRLYEFPIHSIYPPVDKLPLHLPGEQSILFQDGEAGAALDRGPPDTKLTAYFKLNYECLESRAVLYPDIPSKFTWNQKDKKWKLRQRGSSVGRIPTVSLSPHQSEKYYLRLLLHNKSGATSFEDLRTINDVVHPTFNTACRALGLLEDDTEIDKAMEEAASIRFGNNLRDIFVTLLVNCLPSNASELWKNWRRSLCEDKMRQSKESDVSNLIESQVLIYIRDRLERDGLSLKHFDLPEPTVEHLVATEHRIIREETEFDFTSLEIEVQNGYPSLNAEQKHVFDSVMSSIENGNGTIFCLNASGGTGKTHTMNLLLANIRSKGDVAIATATSGIAATLLSNGRTLHSRCHLPFNITENSTCSMARNSPSAKLFNQAKLLIIDEVSMGHKYWYEAVDKSLQDVRKKPGVPFGGLTVLFSGDWKQILPVVKHGGRVQIIDACLKQSYLWEYVTEFTLSTNMRLISQADSNEFASYLIDLGTGHIPIFKELGDFKMRIPDDLLHSSNDLKDLCQFVFEGLSTNYKDGSWLCSRAIIASTNANVDQINAFMMEQFPGEKKIYKSCDTVTENEHQYPLEFINRLIPSGLPSHELVLKKHSSIMLLRNLDPANGHCNGTRYYIQELHEHIIEAVVAYGAHAGKKLFIPRIPLKPSEFDYPFEMKRKQFPVRPAFGITANKSQGQTLNRIGIYLSREMFSHGKSYVAQSRVTSRADLKIMAPNGSYSRKSGKYCDNVVWPEIL